MTTETAKKQARGAVLAAAAIAEAIREASPIPSGHLYAMVCGQMGLEYYEGIITMLIRTGLVERKNHLLTWTRPAISSTPPMAKEAK